MKKNQIIEGLNKEESFKSGYNKLVGLKMVDLTWDEYIDEVADVVVSQNGKIDDGVEIIENFLLKE